MTTENVYIQDSDNNNLLPITDWSNLLNVPSILQSTDKIVTTDVTTGTITGTDSSSHSVTLFYAKFGKILVLTMYNVQPSVTPLAGSTWLTFSGESAFAEASKDVGVMNLFSNSATSFMLRFYTSGSNLVCAPMYSGMSTSENYSGQGIWIIN